MPAKTKGVFNDKEIRTIFSNIEQIRDLSRELFTAIRQQMLNWTDQCMVGDIFTRNVRCSLQACLGPTLALRSCDRTTNLPLPSPPPPWDYCIGSPQMPFMKIYIPYCRDHKAANELIENKKENKKVVMFLKVLSSAGFICDTAGQLADSSAYPALSRG
jgi:hypothetical protein